MEGAQAFTKGVSCHSILEKEKKMPLERIRQIGSSHRGLSQGSSEFCQANCQYLFWPAVCPSFPFRKKKKNLQTYVYMYTYTYMGIYYICVYTYMGLYVYSCVDGQLLPCKLNGK